MYNFLKCLFANGNANFKKKDPKNSDQSPNIELAETQVVFWPHEEVESKNTGYIDFNFFLKITDVDF